MDALMNARFQFMSRLSLALIAMLTLCQCSLLDRVVNSSAVIYALPPQEKMPSLLTHPDKLTPAGPVITFSPNRFLLTARQRAQLQALGEQWKEETPHLLIVGFARRGTPAGYARALSQRRAESVRQVFIEQGIDAAHLHSTGYGHDQPGLSSEDTVKIYIAQ